MGANKKKQIMKQVFVVVNGEGKIHGVYCDGEVALYQKDFVNRDVEMRGSRMLFTITVVNLTE